MSNDTATFTSNGAGAALVDVNKAIPSFPKKSDVNYQWVLLHVKDRLDEYNGASKNSTKQALCDEVWQLMTSQGIYFLGKDGPLDKVDSLKRLTSYFRNKSKSRGEAATRNSNNAVSPPTRPPLGDTTNQQDCANQQADCEDHPIVDEAVIHANSSKSSTSAAKKVSLKVSEAGVSSSTTLNMNTSLTKLHSTTTSINTYIERGGVLQEGDYGFTYVGKRFLNLCMNWCLDIGKDILRQGDKAHYYGTTEGLRISTDDGCSQIMSCRRGDGSTAYLKDVYGLSVCRIRDITRQFGYIMKRDVIRAEIIATFGNSPATIPFLVMNDSLLGCCSNGSSNDKGTDIYQTIFHLNDTPMMLTFTQNENEEDDDDDTIIVRDLVNLWKRLRKDGMLKFEFESFEYDVEQHATCEDHKAFWSNHEDKFWNELELSLWKRGLAELAVHRQLLRLLLVETSPSTNKSAVEANEETSHSSTQSKVGDIIDIKDSTIRQFQGITTSEQSRVVLCITSKPKGASPVDKDSVGKNKWYQPFVMFQLSQIVTFPLIDSRFVAAWASIVKYYLKQNQRTSDDEQWKNWSEQWLLSKYNEKDCKFTLIVQMLRKWDRKAEVEWLSRNDRGLY